MIVAVNKAIVENPPEDEKEEYLPIKVSDEYIV
jgi:hypothetical protein